MEFFFNFVFLFFLCFWFSLQFFYQGIKYTWLAYVILIVWPVWIWILPLFFNAPKTEAPNASKKQQKTNNEQKANKEVVIAQSGLPRLLHMIVVGSCNMLVNLKGNFGGSPLLAYALLVVGSLLLIWARISLSDQWSGRPEARKDHKLITRGPYACIRHPIYTAIMIICFGSALLSGSIVAYVAALLTTIMYLFKLRIEEQILIQQFGDEYRRYSKHTNALIPFIY